jgi:hypothetical protein
MMAEINQTFVRQAVADKLDMLLEAIEFMADSAMNAHGFEFAHEDEHDINSVGDFTDKEAHKAVYADVLATLAELMPCISAAIAKHNAPFLLREAAQPEIEAALLSEGIKP